MIAGYAIAIVILLMISAFFSGSETALTAASRARMHALERDGDKRARTVNKLLANRENFIGAILLGNNVVNIFNYRLTYSASSTSHRCRHKW